jgi:sulfatase maturation enzyme AslB (radical SAM superfamily)
MNNYYDISITTYCQLFCAGCQRNDQDNNLRPEIEQQHMSDETFDMIIEQIDKVDNCDVIQFCGELGDPMMHPRIDRFIERATKSATKIIINTNAALRNPDFYEKWAKDPREIHIEFGIDGLDHETNDKYRRGANFKKAWENMTTWFKHTKRGSWHFILFEWNMHQVPEVARIAKEIGCKVTYKITKSDTGKDGIVPRLHNKAIQLVDQYAT